MEPNRSILITGAANGIGAAVARMLVAEGAKLVLLDTDRAALDGIAAELGEGVIGVHGSVADPADCRRAVTAAIAQFGGLDGVSHNAGIQRYGDVVETSHAQWAAVLTVNLTGAFNIAKAAIETVRQRRGAIVFMASVNSFAAQRHAVAYVTAKHGLLGLVRSMALDEARHGVRINGVAPGSVDTPMLRDAIARDNNPAALSATIDAMHPIGRRGLPEEIAQVVSFLLSDQSSFMTGEMVRADGGLLLGIAGAPR